MNNTPITPEILEANEPRKLRFNVGAIFLILYVIVELIDFIPNLELYSPFSRLISALDYISLIALAVVTIIKKRGIPLVAVTGLVLLIHLVNFGISIGYIVTIILYTSMLLMALLDLNIEALKKYESIIKKAFIIVFAISAILNIVSCFSYILNPNYILTILDIGSRILLTIFYLLGIFLTGSWISDPYEKPKTASNKTSSDNTVSTNESFISLGKHVVLLLFTCGILLLMWIYKTTRFTNSLKGEPERNPTSKLILYIFIPFYSIYWTYKTAALVDNMAKEKNLQSDLSTICLILAIFVPFVPPILIQDKINQIVTAPEATAAQQTDAAVSEFEKYKSMFENGLITEEEYNAKRKQLLGL